MLVNIPDMTKRAPPTRPRGRHFLRQWRKHRDLTQEQASERLEIEQGTLSKIERGLVPYNQDFLERAALAYGCEPSDLLDIDPLAPNAPKLIYTRLAKADPATQRRALDVLEALLKAS